MSGPSQSYVERSSPYVGNFYTIHLRLGLLANETNHYRLWIKDETLAKLCRCSTKTVQRAKQQMVKDGYLKLVESARAQAPAVYEFVFKDEGGQNVHPGGVEGGHPVPRGWTSGESSPIYRKEIKESETPFDLEPLPSLHDHAAQVRAAITAMKSLTNR